MDPDLFMKYAQFSNKKKDLIKQLFQFNSKPRALQEIRPSAVESRDQFGRTPAHYAAYAGHMATLKWLAGCVWYMISTYMVWHIDKINIYYYLDLYNWIFSVINK